ATTPLRGGRGRGGFESSRGGRGRGTDRGRGGFRGVRGGHAAGTDSFPKDTAAVSVPTTESPAWDNVAAEPAAPLAWDTPATTESGAWGNATAADSTPTAVPDVAKSAALSESSGKKTWASMFAKPKPPPVPVVPKQPTQAAAPAAVAEPTPAPAELTEQTESSSTVPQNTVPEPTQQLEPEVAPAAVEEQPTEIAQTETAPIASEPSPAAAEPSASAEADLSSAHAPLTEDNLEHLPDTSIKPATQTVASTVGSIDPRVATPATSQQQAPIGRPPMGGYAASAYRAAGTPNRNSSYQRRVLEQ
ncbi:hypothetical protein KCU71_g23304, partial [Aureobasidium melanogenum]